MINQEGEVEEAPGKYSPRLTSEQVKAYRVAALAEKLVVALLSSERQWMVKRGKPAKARDYAKSAVDVATALVELAPYPEEK